MTIKNLKWVATVVATTLLFACSKSSELKEPTTQSLSVSNRTLSQTKVAFTDNSGKDIDLRWEVSDRLSITSTEGELIGHFTCNSVNDSGLATFTAEQASTQLIEGTSYIAKYPATDQEPASHTQIGTSANHLDQHCTMQAEFVFGEQTINLEHQKAIMSIAFSTPNDSVPTSLTFTDGSQQTQTLTFEQMQSAPIYIAYLCIEPTDGTARDLKFEFTTADNNWSEQRTSKVEYFAGYRYTAPFTLPIYDGDDLAKIDSFEGKAVLMNNITLTGTWTPISDINTTLDGNNHTISGLTIESNSEGYVGMIRKIGENGVARRLNILEPEVNGAKQYCGTIAGENKGKIEACNIIGGEIKAPNGTAYGAICGSNNKGAEIIACSNSATVNGKLYTGGIAGFNQGTIAACYNNGSTSSLSSTYIGGIVGYNYNGEIIGCYNNAMIIGTKGIGGIAGYTNITPTSCYWVDYEGDSATADTATVTLEELKSTKVEEMNQAIGDYTNYRFQSSAEYPTLYLP